jgi:hypothetical protein
MGILPELVSKRLKEEAGECEVEAREYLCGNLRARDNGNRRKGVVSHKRYSDRLMVGKKEVRRVTKLEGITPGYPTTHTKIQKGLYRLLIVLRLSLGFWSCPSHDVCWLW